MQPGRPRLIVVLVASCVLAVPTEAATIQIVMQNLDISPAEASAKVGDTIEWTNKDIVAHTATARNGDFDVMLPLNKTGSFVLKKDGAVDYYCRFHPNMKATLKIEQ
jgi:plastocyanin